VPPTLPRKTRSAAATHKPEDKVIQLPQITPKKSSRTRGPFPRLDESVKPKIVEPAKLNSTDESVLTERQKEVQDFCISLADIHFTITNRPAIAMPIKPRLYPLISAPTGAGKSDLIRALADQIGAKYYRFQRGDFIPQGSNRHNPTLHLVLDAVLQSAGRILVHLDELDKWYFGENLTPAQEWSASIFSDLFSLLDGALPIDAYLQSEHRVKTVPPVTKDQLLIIARQIFIVGSGT